MNSAELKKAKRAIRRRILARRDALPQHDRARLGRRAVDHLLTCPELQAQATVFAFWAFGSEVPTAPLLERLHRSGCTVCLPRIEGTDIRPVAYRPDDELRETGFGAMEPSAGSVVAERDVDVIVTPAVAFDLDGHRVGYGGGYYDRFFARADDRAFRVGLAFELQVLSDPLPAGNFDLRVDAVATEARVLRFSRAEREG
jgi:5-formyltetrahydrofolate cyclo-ligase